jgi:hypothetical protein
VGTEGARLDFRVRRTLSGSLQTSGFAANFRRIRTFSAAAALDD